MALQLHSVCSKQIGAHISYDNKIVTQHDENDFGKALTKFVKDHDPEEFEEFTTHDLRVSKATLMYGTGHDLEALRLFLGHGS